MSEFERFIRWAKAKGHYQTVDAINRYLQLSEEDRERAIITIQDTEVLGSTEIPYCKDNNCK